MGRNNKASLYDSKFYMSPIYRSWYNMKTRCLNPKSTNFIRWGGRGISICEKWMKFDGFLEDMLPSYTQGYQLDRINNDGNYELSNCRWVDRKTQCRNRSNNTMITIGGITKTLSEWIDVSGIKSSTVRQRMYVYKWPIDKCFTIKI